MKSIWEQRDRRYSKIVIGLFFVGLVCIIVKLLLFSSSDIGLNYLAAFLFFIGLVIWFNRLDDSDSKTADEAHAN